MVPMPRGRRLSLPLLALVAGAAPTLTACGLFDGGSPLEDAFEYLPADTYQVRFADRLAMAERLEVDDLDPRDVSESDFDDYVAALSDEDGTALADSELGQYLSLMRSAPLNGLDVEWEAFGSWGDPDGESRGAAYVWKVGDDVDFDALADDLEDKGYEKGGSGDLPMFANDISNADDHATFGGVYPSFMQNVLLDEDEQVVVAAVSADSLADVADVIADDSDSLADDGGMDKLLDVADGGPELAWLTSGGPDVCAGADRLPPQASKEYGDLGRPQARAFFVSGDDEPQALLALRYASEDAAKDDLAARQALVEEGSDAQTAQPFAALGDFDLEQDGRFVLIEEDFDAGPRAALAAEQNGAGPGICIRAAG